MPSSMMMSSKRPRRSSLTTSVWIMPFLVNKKTSLVERCTSRIRLRSMPMRSSKSWRTVPTFTSGKFFSLPTLPSPVDFVFHCTRVSNFYFFVHISFYSGLKGMMPGIQDMLKTVAEKKGLDYDEWLKGLKSKKQWHVEVY
mmetsp:Transcript_32084/g.78153  ORF Transcript_32084/g.78153 Transcript_32084/m.78153 type:complete len:141 (+) Transcript_32084:319-741(+)